MSICWRALLLGLSVGLLIRGVTAQNVIQTGDSVSNPMPPVLPTEAAFRFVGGPDFNPVAIKVDAEGNIYVGGNQPTQRADGSPGSSVILYKLNPQFEQIFQMQLSGDGGEGLSAMAMDPAENVYLAGTTVSANFQTLNPVQAQLGGSQDAFLTKVDPDGNVLFSTYLGGSGTETIGVITVDADGNAFLTGQTRSADFPTTPNAYISDFQPSQSSPELYVAKIATGSGTLEYSTGFGMGTWFDNFRGIVEVSGGDVFLLLGPSPTDFAVTDDSINGGSGQLLARLSADGSTLVYASYADMQSPTNSLILDGNGNPSGGCVSYRHH